jgi:hypothetical protein
MDKQLEAMRATVSKARIFRKVFIPVNPGRAQKENGKVTALSPAKAYCRTFYPACAQKPGRRTNAKSIIKA